MPVGKHFTGGVSLVNGWNNVEDNNSGKTLSSAAPHQLQSHLVKQLHCRT